MFILAYVCVCLCVRVCTRAGYVYYTKYEIAGRLRERICVQTGRRLAKLPLKNTSERFRGSETTEPAWLPTNFGIGERFVCSVGRFVRRLSAPRVRTSRGCRFLSVHAAHGAPSLAPPPPFSSLFDTFSFPP